MPTQNVVCFSCAKHPLEGLLRGETVATENVNSQETAFSIPNLAIAPKAEDNKVVLVSERKLRANQQNAKRSTGPRTLRGKANSRRNATKHGFFASSAIGFAMLGED